MKKVLLIILILLVVLAAGGCGGSRDAAAPGESGGAVSYESQAAGDAATKEIAADSKANGQPDGGIVAEEAPQKIIRTVMLSLTVPDVEKTVGEIESLLKNVNGYVQDANLWQSDNNLQGYLTLRVPTAKVDGIIPQLEALGRVERKEVSGQDVTEEYYDVEARKNNLKKQEERYLELLAKANTVKDMLEIESALARVRGDIESMEARLKVLNDRVDLATINVELRAPKSLSAGDTLREPFGDRIQTGWQRGVNGMINFVQDLVVLFVILLPYTPILALLGYVLYRIGKKRRLLKKGNEDLNIK